LCFGLLLSSSLTQQRLQITRKHLPSPRRQRIDKNRMQSSDVNHQQAIIFFVIASISTVFSFLSMRVIWIHGNSKSVSSQLLLLLHATLLLEEVSTLPYTYSGNSGLCKTFGFIHIYSGLANIVVIGLLTLHYCNHVLFSNLEISHFLSNTKYYWIFGFPLIALLPFSTNSYGTEQDVWCTITSSSKDGQVWFVAAQFLWIWVILVFSICMIIYVVYRASQLDHGVAHSIFSSIGIYVFVSVLCWIPRSLTKTIQGFFENQNDAHFWTTMPLFLAGAFYGLILLRDRQVLRVDDSQYSSSRDSSTGGHGDFNFSWEDLDKILEDSEERLTIPSKKTEKVLNMTEVKSPLQSEEQRLKV
jgi:hypothetical protein